MVVGERVSLAVLERPQPRRVHLEQLTELVPDGAADRLESRPQRLGMAGVTHVSGLERRDGQVVSEARLRVSVEVAGQEVPGTAARLGEDLEDESQPVRRDTVPAHP